MCSVASGVSLGRSVASSRLGMNSAMKSSKAWPLSLCEDEKLSRISEVPMPISLLVEKHMDHVGLIIEDIES